MKTSLILATFVGLFALTAAVLRTYAEQEPAVLDVTIPYHRVLSSATVAQNSLEESSMLVAAISSEAATTSSIGNIPYASASTSAKQELLTANQLPGAQIAGQAAVQNKLAKTETVVIATPSPIAKPVATLQPIANKPELPVSHWDAMFEKYAAEYGVDARKLKVIAKCESTYRQDAVNGPYGGMYQYLASTWSATRTAMGEDPNPELRFDGEQAIKTTAWKIAHGGIGAWPHCGKL